MKMLATLSIILAGASTLFAANYSIPLDKCAVNSQETGYEIINLKNTDRSTLERFFSGQYPNIVLECVEGDNFPIQLCLSGNFLNLVVLEQPKYVLKMMKPCFIRFDGDNFLFSVDLSDWKEFKDFFSGKLSFSIDEVTMQMTFNLEINQPK